MKPDACAPLAEPAAEPRRAPPASLMAVIGGVALATAALADAPVAPSTATATAPTAVAAPAKAGSPTYAAARGMQPGS